MSIDDAERLQRAIDEILLRSPQAERFRIVLDQGSDVIDLSANVDVRVSRGDMKDRYFMIATAQNLHEVLGDSQRGPVVPDEEWDLPAEWRGLYSTGGPLVVVREITAEIVVRAVRRYLDQEEWEQNHPTGGRPR